MPAPHPIELRERVVAAYERGRESYDVVAATFGVARSALQRWVRLYRTTDSVEPRARGGGNFSPVDVALLEKLVLELRDATSHELTVAYNRLVGRSRRVHRSSIHRALHRSGYVFKKKWSARRSAIDPMSERSELASCES